MRFEWISADGGAGNTVEAGLLEAYDEVAAGSARAFELESRLIRLYFRLKGVPRSIAAEASKGDFDQAEVKRMVADVQGLLE